MIQKATWIIPGILVTLLLGLLWAMPAFAAEAGSIEFLGAKGDDDEISYVSLNGPAADGGFWFQVSDSDLDTIVKRTGEDAYVVSITANTDVPNDGIEDWHNVQDMNGDGTIDNRDFKAVDLGNDDAVGGTGADADTAFDFTDDTTVEYSRTNGTLSITGAVTGIDHDGDTATTTTELDVQGLAYWIKKQTIIGARNGSDKTAMYEFEPSQRGGVNTANVPGTLDPAVDTSLVDGDDTWVKLLGSKISDLTTRAIGPLPAAATAGDDDDTPVVALETEIAKYIKAYNKGDGSGKPLDVTVNVTPVPHVGLQETAPTVPVDSRQVGSISVTINNSDDTGDIDDETVCVGLAQKATPDRPDTGTGSTGDIPADDYDCDNTDTDTTGVVVYEDSDVVVEVIYTGSTATVYSSTGRIGEEDEVGRVTVDSSGASQSISVLLKETGSATGIFGTKIMICTVGTGADECSSIPTQAGEDADSDGTGMIMIPVEAAGDTITISYRDGSPRGTRRATIALDPSGPSFNNMSPASGTAGREDEPTVSFEAVDGESGLSDDEDVEDSIYVVAGLYDIGEKVSFDSVVYVRDDLDSDEVTNGFEVSVTIDEGTKAASAPNDRLDAGDKSEYEIRWWAVAVDMAGNVGVSDQNGDTVCDMDALNQLAALEFSAVRDQGEANAIILALEGTIMAKDGDTAAKGCDPHVIRVDSAKPVLSLAETGYYLDGDEEKGGSTTSIVARFSEALDCDTVSADDFEVDGAAPNDVTCDGMNVYLDVDELDSNDTPDVSVAEGAVADRAGNAIGADQEVESKDVIPAGITVTVTGTAEGDRPITTKEITINISSDEQMKGRPTVDIRMIEDDYSLGDNLGSDATSTGNANEWSLSKDIGDAGLYNVYVTAEDRAASGLSIAGLRPGEMMDDPDSDDPDDMVPSTKDFTLNADQVKGTKVILFEVDDSIADPVFTPEDDGETDDANTFIRVNFKYEGKEYGLSGDDEETTATDETGTFSTSGEAISNKGGVSFDTSGTVTVTSAMFNGEDVTEDVATRDWVLYVFRPGDLTDGDHKLELEVEDAAGNERDDIVLEFSKVAKKPYELSINPGPNLVSFPANPADGDINAVFGGEGNEDISRVLTFDNVSGLWMAATKGADGAFMGDLTNINGMNGYWVVSDGIVDISVVLAGSGDVTTTPPHIAVSEGWNLIGVVDTGQRQSHGIATNDYFANVDAQVVYGFDSFAGKLVRLSTAALTAAQVEAKETQDMVETGMGYWVYANEAGIIIP